MKEDKAITAVGVLTVILSLLMMSVGKFIMGGIILLIAFGIFWNRGGGTRNDRSIYEKIIKTDMSVAEIYEKIRDLDTPLGKPWIAENKGFAGDSIVFGPCSFKDCVVISRGKNCIDVKHVTRLENIIRKTNNITENTPKNLPLLSFSGMYCSLKVQFTNFQCFFNIYSTPLKAPVYH